MKIFNINLKKLQSGISLPITILFSFICSGILFSYVSTIYDKDFSIQYQITETKALYNAESGIALEAYPSLFKKDYEHDPELDLANKDVNKQMGSYSVIWREEIDSITVQPVRYAEATGIAELKHILGNKKIEIKRKKRLVLAREGLLSEFLYLTNSEAAGGGPFSFEQDGSRRPVVFGGNDSINPEWPNSSEEAFCDVAFQSNSSIEMSQFSAPEFNITYNVTIDSLGDVHSPIMNGWNINQVFQGDPKLDTLECINLPPKGYEENKELIEGDDRHLTIDATEKLKWNANFTQRDTLIMTDIEFFVKPVSYY